MLEQFSLWWNKIRTDGSFTQNYAVVLSGTGLNILVQIFVTPIITRLYGPESYGVYSLFIALSTNFALIASLRLPQAIILPKEETDFRALMRVGLLSSFVLNFMFFIALYFFNESILHLFNAEKLSPYYYLIPVMGLLICLNQFIGGWQYRINVFKKSVALDTATLIGVRVFNLAYPFFSKGTTMGLVFGDILGKVAGLILSWRFVFREKMKELFVGVSRVDFTKVYKDYKVYPLVNLPGVWMETFSGQLPVFFVSIIYGLPSLGLLSLAVGIMDIPKRLFAYSANSVFFKKAVDIYEHSPNELSILVVRTLYLLLAVSVIPYAVVMVFGQELFAFVLGESWRASGLLARYLAMYYVVELLCISLGPVFYVLRREKILFGFQIGFLLIRLIILFLSYLVSFPIEKMVFALSITNVALYCVQLAMIFGLLKLSWYKYILVILFSVTVLTASLFGIRYLLAI